MRMPFRLCVWGLLGLVSILPVCAQSGKVTVSGIVADGNTKQGLAYVNVVIKALPDSTFTGGTATNDAGFFSVAGIPAGNYVLETSYLGYTGLKREFLAGRLNDFLDLGVLEVSESATALTALTVSGSRDAVAETLDKKTFRIEDNIVQSGGSLLQVMQNLPGVTVSNEGTVKLRGSDRVALLIDGKQTALTGFGNQTSLDNIPASAIERIEVINNPSSRYDANANAGIINIIYKKEVKEGFNGKAGIALGAGALWVKKESFPDIRPQYTATPKINPSLSLNFRRKNRNLFLQVDNLYTKTLNKNEFVDRYYDTGDTVRQQTVRNRTTNIVTAKGGADWYLDDRNTLSVSGLFSSEKILDEGDEPFYNAHLTERLRLWQFLEDELKTTVTVSANWQHKYAQPGRLLNIGYNYTFHREDEKYFFTNVMPTFTGKDSFALISDEHVSDLNVDYVQPLKYGRFETGVKFRVREIPTNMKFYPGVNSPLDTTAGGWATYSEIIPALYGNYVFENRDFEAEAGLRVEYVNIYYQVNPDHVVYKSDGYNYTQPFPSVRLAWKLNENNTLSMFYNRRVDRPNEVDIRIFPKYDDAEIIKVGNPALRPQFTNNFELGYKTSAANGYLYLSLYHKRMESIITRIASIEPGNTLIYNIFQNAGNSRSYGMELILSANFGKLATLNLNLNGYHNTIDPFTVTSIYPAPSTYTSERQDLLSGSVKLNGVFHLSGQTDLQFSGVYQAADVVPQGKTYPRFGLDVGAKKSIQDGKGELFINATDLLNTMVIKKEVSGAGFHYVSSDYYETQVVRVGYNLKF